MHLLEVGNEVFSIQMDFALCKTTMEFEIR